MMHESLTKKHFNSKSWDKVMQFSHLCNLLQEQLQHVKCIIATVQ